MNRHILKPTDDGSPTLWDEVLGENFHSLHGALTESLHVFISGGLEALPEKGKIGIFECGFGTGLNAWLSAMHAEEMSIAVRYVAVDAFPVSEDVFGSLNYAADYTEAYRQMYEQIQKASWEEEVRVSPCFTLLKKEIRFEEYQAEEKFDLIYYDAFSPNIQPELWTVECFQKCYALLNPGGLLLTYSAKGEVKRALKEAGFTIENLPGPPGKREITRAVKN